MSELHIPSTSSCAFIFVDIQPVFTDLFTETDFKAQTERALSFARKAVPSNRIVHLRANYVGSKMVPFNRILNPNKTVPSDITATSWAKEEPGETVITKATINGFHETNLEELLIGLGVETIILCGLITSCCVHETAIGGLIRGFTPVLVEDGCVDKPEKHAATLMMNKDFLYQTCVLQDIKHRFDAV